MKRLRGSSLMCADVWSIWLCQDPTMSKQDTRTGSLTVQALLQANKAPKYQLSVFNGISLYE
jgi:hypothetical protein